MWTAIEVLRSPDGVDGGGGESLGSGDASTPAIGTSTTVEASDDTGGSGEFDFPDDFGDSTPVGAEGRDDAPPVVSPKPTSEQAPVATATVPKEPVTPAATTPQQPASQTPPAAATEQQQAPAQPQAAASQAELEENQSLLQRLDAGRTALEEALVQTMFKPDAKDLEAIDAGDLSTVLPRLQTKVYVEAVRTTLNIVERAMPQLVAHAVQAQAEQRAGDDEFYGQFGDLKEHRQQVFEIARTIRALNPEMPKDAFLKTLGQTARAMLGIQVPTTSAALPQTVPVRANGGHQPVVSAVPPNVGPVRPAAGDDWGQISDLLGAP